jgi:hypothetical protein
MIVAFAARWLIAASSLQKAKQIAGTVHFRGSLLIRMLFGVVIPTSLYGALTVAFSPTAKDDWWVSLILGVLGIGTIIGWPEQIVTSSEGISQSKILGLGWRTIRWPDVDYATENQTSGGVEVVPRQGRKIILSSMHTGREEFLEILRDHCRVS